MRRPSNWWAFFQLTAIALYLPLFKLVSGTRAVLAPSSTWAVGLLVSCGAFLFYHLLSIALKARWMALAVTSVTTVFFWNWNVGVEHGWLITASLYALVVAGAVQVANLQIVRTAALIASVTFTSTLALVFVVQEISAPDPVITPVSAIEQVTVTATPDIVLIVLDGYARADVLRDIYDFDNEPFLSELRNMGFEIAENSTTNYSSTHLALPALLQMSLVHEPGDELTFSDHSQIKKMISGDNRIVHMLKRFGYSYTHAEGDRRLHACGEQVDECLDGNLIDITTFELLNRTPLRRLLSSGAGDPDTALSLEMVETLKSWDDNRGAAIGPDFIFFHLMVPHPPMFLDQRCELRIDARLAGRAIDTGKLSARELRFRRDAWIEQLKCANRATLDFIARLSHDDVVLLLSDHGPDSVYNSLNDTSSDAALLERMANLTALRLPERCMGSVPRDLQLHNVFRVVLACLSETEIRLLENESYVAGFTGAIIPVDLSGASG